MDERPLAAIIAQAQRGDAAALEALVDRYGHRLFGFFYRLAGHRNDAEDLTQEVFVRVVRMVAAYKDDGRFEAWLFRIAANLARDRIRRSRRMPPRLLTDSDDSAEDPLLDVAHDASPAEPLERAEDVDRLNAALEQLPDAEREIIMLRHFSQLSFKEIADMLGLPLGTALARSHRGLLRLRGLMEASPARKAEPPASDVPPPRRQRAGAKK